jgi:hypothetical protein
MTLMPAISETLKDSTRAVGGDISRLSVGDDGRLYWDDKPVVVRRRLQLSFWQKLGTIFIGFAALMIAVSAAVHAGITAHDWMCSAKWVTGSCSKSPAAMAAPLQNLPPRVELPN